MEHKNCPLGKHYDVDEGIVRFPCETHLCAWYDNFHKQCAILTIALEKKL